MTDRQKTSYYIYNYKTTYIYTCNHYTFYQETNAIFNTSCLKSYIHIYNKVNKNETLITVCSFILHIHRKQNMLRSLHAYYVHIWSTVLILAASPNILTIVTFNLLQVILIFNTEMRTVKPPPPPSE